MENYLLVNNYGKSNTPDRIYYIMRRSDLSNLIKEESVVFGDKAYILEEGTMMFMGNDGIWYDTEGEVPVITTKELNVTENGTYADPDPYVAYRPVNVQVTDYNVEELNVVENGTYSEPGKAYSPVVVNVPLPENAYLKKDLPTGAIATVTDAEAEIMPSLKVAITPVQSGSGDPSPENIRPISGWTGANIVDCGDSSEIEYFENLSKGIYGVVDLGSLTWSYETTWIEGIEVFHAIISGMATGATTFSCPLYANVGTRGKLVTNDMTMARLNSSSSAVLIRNDSYTDAIAFRTAMEGVKLIYELAEPTAPTVTANEMRAIISSYNVTSQTYPIPFPSEAGTVYGGTLDVTTGVLTVDRAMVDLGTLTPYQKEAGVYGLHVACQTNGQIVCSAYPVGSGSGGSTNPSNIEDKTIITTIYVGTYYPVFIKDTDYTSAADFKTAMNGVQLCYELATPQTYQLTPTEVQMLLGTNNIWADTGDILEGKYWSKNPVTVTQAMFNTLQDAGEITEIKPEEPEEPEENDER